MSDGSEGGKNVDVEKLSERCAVVNEFAQVLAQTCSDIDEEGFGFIVDGNEVSENLDIT